MANTDWQARIDRLESLDEIRQLVAKYSLSLDMRDLDAHVNLFAPDIRVSRDKTGRAHLKRWLDDTLRLQFTGTSHHVGNHIIEFEDPDHAIGVLYSKNEHETPCENGDTEWVIMQMRWPDREPYEGAFHELFPSWQEFWANPPASDEPEVAAPAPLEEFLRRMRRGAPDPRIKVR